MRLSTITDKVGIGTSNPLAKFAVGGQGSSTATIYGETVDGYGVYGHASAINGRAVYGRAQNTATGANYGGYFQADASNGKGVFGFATGSSGRGVDAFAEGAAGQAVRGNASNEGAVTNYGGYFLAGGETGNGVYGKASSTATATTQNFGGYFESAGGSGRGAAGFASGINGQGVRGQSSGSSGIGVYGWATNAGDVENYGGRFMAGGMTGRGVYGYAMHDTGVNYGVYGETDSPVGWAGYFEGRGYFSSNVGIDISNPTELLDINGTAKMTGFKLPTGASAGHVLISDANGVGTWQAASSAGGWTDGGSNVYLTTIGDKVGIGTTNPLSKLSVGGNGGSQATIYGGAIGDNSFGVYGGASTSSAYGVYGSASGSSGRGVSGYASGSALYGVHGSAWDDGEVTNYGGYFQARGTTGRGVYGAGSGTSGIGVYGNGVSSDFWAQHGTYDGPSSIRWKSNIVEIANPLEKLAVIRGVYFDWDEEHGGGHTVGMIAEEVGKVLPEIVVYEENGIDAKGMDYSKITPLLVEAIKALQKRVEELENR